MRFPVSFVLRALVLVLFAGCLHGAAAPPARAVPMTYYELEGPDRYATAVDISQQEWGAGAPAVVISTGLNWPDALGGSAIAGAIHGPILLVRQNSIPAVTLAEIGRLGPSVAYILGGEGAVGPAVEAQLAGKVGAANVRRIGGNDRYETSNALASEAIDLANGQGGYSGIAYVATGATFPDSLAAGPVSAYLTRPIFLANPVSDSVPAAYMKSLGVSHVVILGGTAAVSTNQQLALESEFPGHVERIWGPDRYTTAARIAQYCVDHCVMYWDWSALATGEQFPDALAGGAFSANHGSVLLITPSNSLHFAVETKYSNNPGAIAHLYFLGGTSALSEEVREDVRAILD